MDLDNAKVIDDVFSIFKSSYPELLRDSKDERYWLNEVTRCVEKGAYDAVDYRVRDIYLKYTDNINKLQEHVNSGENNFLGSISDRVFSFFKTQASVSREGLWKQISNWFYTILPSIGKFLTFGVHKGISEQIDIMASQGYIDKEGAEYLKSLSKDDVMGGIVTEVALAMTLVTGFFKVSGELMMGDYIKKMNAKFTPNYLDPNTLIKALHIAPEKVDEINKKLAENGLDSSDIELMKISGYSLYDLNMVKECYLRNIISQDIAQERMSELGFTPARTKEIMSTWEVIPSPQDLFWMVGKEAFEDDQISRFGLGAEFPDDQVEWLEKQGISKFWAQKYWIAHWDYPGESRVLDLFHRGLINDNDLDQFYRVIEIPPFWRERLKKASYSLYTRVDLRRMHDLGIISDKDVYDNFRGEGYDDEHAKRMTQFYIQYNEDNNKDLTRSQIERAYESDLITKAQAIEMLESLKYTRDQATFMIEIVDYNEEIKRQKLMIKSIEKMYKHKDIDSNRARSMLSNLHVETKWVEAYLTQWETELSISERLPTKEDLMRWLGNNFITEQQFTSYMKKLNFADSTIKIYISEITGRVF